MSPPTRGVARALNTRSQWRRLASTTSSSPPRPPRPPRPAGNTKPAAPNKDAPLARPYKPTTPRIGSRNNSSPATTAPPPPPPPPRPETLLDHWRNAWLPLSGAALLAGCLGFYIFGTATASLKSPSAPSASPCSSSSSSSSSSSTAPCEHSTPTGRPPALTGENAELFDKELDLPEWWMGVSAMRKRLAAAATGHVLEVAVGTGRNLEHYNWDALSAAVALAQRSSDPLTASPRVVRPKGISSFTGLDISIDMLDLARRKLTTAVPPLASSAPIVRASAFPSGGGGGGGGTGSQLSFLDGHVRLISADAHDPLPPPHVRTSAPSTSAADNKNESINKYYDTVTQTFGLCSVRDPVGVLANLAAAVRPGTGRIILLEHGKGWYGLVNGLLDRNADKHFAKYGCWWNRDIESLVEEAARRTPGLEIISIERPKITQMGTLVWVELRVAVDGEGKQA